MTNDVIALDLPNGLRGAPESSMTHIINTVDASTPPPTDPRSSAALGRRSQDTTPIAAQTHTPVATATRPEGDRRAMSAVGRPRRCLDCGDEYRASADGRCPACRLRESGASLADRDPALAAHWHPSKNGDLLPSQVTRYSSTPVWWLCPRCGHVRRCAPKSKSTHCSACRVRLAARAQSDEHAEETA